MVAATSVASWGHAACGTSPSMVLLSLHMVWKRPRHRRRVSHLVSMRPLGWQKQPAPCYGKLMRGQSPPDRCSSTPCTEQNTWLKRTCPLAAHCVHYQLRLPEFSLGSGLAVTQAGAGAADQVRQQTHACTAEPHLAPGLGDSLLREWSRVQFIICMLLAVAFAFLYHSLRLMLIL